MGSGLVPLASATRPLPPKLTVEVFSIPLEESGRFVVYAPLRRSAFVANGSVVNFLARLQQGEWDAAADPEGSLVEFLRFMGLVDSTPETEPITLHAGVPEPTSVTLFLTTACNLRCTYCYASAGDTPTRSMTFEVAKRGIDFVSANAKKRGAARFEVVYHGGGEPTTNWQVMTESHAYACRRAAELGLETPLASASSNGVLRDDQIDWMIANLNGGVSVSYDGTPEVNDRHRLTILGHGSSHRVTETLRRFDASGMTYGIRVTVTADNIANLPDSVDYICSNFSTHRIQVEPSFQLGRWKEAPSAETVEFIEAFRLAQQKARQHDRSIFFSAVRTGLSNHFCGVTQDAFSLSPDGNVSACYEVFSEDSPAAPTFFYGQPDAADGYRFDFKILNHLRGQGVENREFCQGCFAKWTCAGDCYHKSVSSTGQLEFQGTDRCHITRELTKDQILTNIATSGGLFWRGSDTGTAAVQGKESLL